MKARTVSLFIRRGNRTSLKNSKGLGYSCLGQDEWLNMHKQVVYETFLGCEESLSSIIVPKMELSQSVDFVYIA
jgi:hypothetical protein